MKNKPPYQYTKYLILVFIFFIIASYIKEKKFHSYEIYPFFWWQLFTNPTKGSTPFTMLRLYEITKSNDTIRLSNDNNGIDDTAYNSLLNEAYSKIEKKLPNENINNFIYNIGIEKSQNNMIPKKFILMKEIYNNPIKLTSENHEFKTEILFISTSR